MNAKSVFTPGTNEPSASERRSRRTGLSTSGVKHPSVTSKTKALVREIRTNAFVNAFMALLWKSESTAQLFFAPKRELFPVLNDPSFSPMFPYLFYAIVPSEYGKQAHEALTTWPGNLGKEQPPQGDTAITAKPLCPSGLSAQCGPRRLAAPEEVTAIHCQSTTWGVDVASPYGLYPSAHSLATPSAHSLATPHNYRRTTKQSEGHVLQGRG